MAFFYKRSVWSWLRFLSSHTAFIVRQLHRKTSKRLLSSFLWSRVFFKTSHFIMNVFITCNTCRIPIYDFMKVEKCRDIISSLPSHFCARKRLDLLAKREVEQSCIVISSKPTDASGLCPGFFFYCWYYCISTVMKVITSWDIQLNSSCFCHFVLSRALIHLFFQGSTLSLRILFEIIVLWAIFLSQEEPLKSLSSFML